MRRMTAEKIGSSGQWRMRHPSLSQAIRFENGENQVLRYQAMIEQAFESRPALPSDRWHPRRAFGLVALGSLIIWSGLSLFLIL